jgi:hypothetical protein
MIVAASVMKDDLTEHNRREYVAGEPILESLRAGVLMTLQRRAPSPIGTLQHGIA